MGALWLLLWKNVQWCRRHPIRTALFYLVPFLLCLFIPLLINLVKIEDVPDCDYEAQALPPSHPAYLLQTTLCANGQRCAEWGKYLPPTELMSWLSQPHDLQQLSGLCPNMERAELETKAEQAFAVVCAERDGDQYGYESLPMVDALMRGHLLYYPQSDSAQAVLAAVARYLDQMLPLKQGLLLANLTGAQPLTASLYELATIAQCYVPAAQRIKGFDNREQLQEYVHGLNYSRDAVWGAIEFMNSSAAFAYNLISHHRSRDTERAFVLQALVETAVTEYLSGVPASNELLMAKYTPERCQKNDKIYGVIAEIAFVVLTLGMIPVAQALASEMAYEKSAGLFEFLLIAGVARWKQKLSWWLFGLFFVATVLLLVSLMFYLAHSRLFEYTPYTVWLILLWLYALALLSECFMVCSWLGTPQRASLVMFVLLLAAYLLPNWAQILPVVGYKGGKFVTAVLFSLLSPSVAVCIGAAYIFRVEALQRGVTWGDLDASPVAVDYYDGVTAVYVVLAVQTVWFMIASLYFDFVAPSKYGVHYPWYFCFQPSFWMRCYKKDTKDTKEASSDWGSRVGTMESEQQQPWSLSLQSLTKQYGANTQPAVDKLSVDLTGGHVTALLGHNGAGKSTTMNMLTGMIQPSGGTAYIGKLDIVHDVDSVRRVLSYCPQYDIIFRELTVDQHMRFYGRLKGLEQDAVEHYAKRLFALMKLDETAQHSTLAKDLSGGMKRKLSIAIAFLGEPKVVILDEPTSAIDPFSRRAIWDVVLASRGSATVLISTHYMQEADILGDNIVIINHGQLVAQGTSMQLKRQYGQGAAVNIAHSAHMDIDRLQDVLGDVTSYKLHSRGERETQLQLLDKRVTVAQLAELSRRLENYADDLGINSFGISEPTLEQVFFNVASDYEPEEPDSGGSDVTAAEQDTLLEKEEAATGCSLLAMQFASVLLKRAYITRRSKLGLLFQVFVPVVFILILVFLNNVIANNVPSTDRQRVHIWSPELRPSQQLVYEGEHNTSWLRLTVQHGLGSACNTPVEDVQCDAGLLVDGRLVAVPVGNEPTTTCGCGPCDQQSDSGSTRLQLGTGDVLVQLWPGRNVTAYLVGHELEGLVGAVQVGTQPAHNGSQLASALAAAMPTMRQLAADGSLYVHPALAIDAASLTNIDVRHLGIAGLPFLNMTNATAMAIFGQYLEQVLVDPLQTGLRVTTLWVRQALPGRFANDQTDTFDGLKAGLLNVYFNSWLRSRVPVSSARAYAIVAYNEEMSFDKDSTDLVSRISGYIVGMFSGLALLMPILNVLIIVVGEAHSGNRQLQLLMGLNGWIFWLANLCWDLLLYLISVGLVMLVMLIFSSLFTVNMSVYFLASLVFGLGMIAFAYVLSYTGITARNAALTVGCVAPLFTFTGLILINFKQESWYDGVNDILMLVPPYFLTVVLIEAFIYDSITTERTSKVMDWSVTGRWFFIDFLTFLFLSAIIALVLLGAFKQLRKCCNKLRSEPASNRVGSASSTAAAAVDADVAAETEAVLAEDAQSDRVLVVQQLSKQFKTKRAVNNLTFGVKRQQCFGLLGVNGAGKSTTFKMLTGYEEPSGGDAYVLGHSMFTEQSAVARHMSYCPQQDVLFDTLTAEEHLAVYGWIRGLSSEARKLQANVLIQEIGLDAHRHKQSHALSGGNKRKLNFAISMLNMPDIVFLDEMTTGMDPRARAATWKVLQKAIRLGTSAVITSHSMEECEALCDRLAIMVNGRFQCIGGVQHLKDAFGNNYNIKLHLQASVDQTMVFGEFEREFSGCELAEQHIGYLEMRLSVEQGLRLSQLFRFIDGEQQRLGILDVSVSQTTLEHVFVGMVNQQE